MEQLTLNEQDRNRIKEQLMKFKIGSAPIPITSTAIVHKEKDQFMTVFLSTVMVLLTVVMMILFALKVKPNKPLQSPIPITQITEEKFDDVENVGEKVEEAVVKKDAEDLQKLKVAVNQLSHQIWMLGLQGNQNTAINKQIDREERSGKYADRYVVVNRSWGLDKKPDSINFSEDDLKKLQEHLNLK